MVASPYHSSVPGGSLVRTGCPSVPDGKTIALLLRENRRQQNAHVIFSHDEGKSWTKAFELCGALTGDRHTAVRLPDGRYFVSFRDMALAGPTRGDWVAWVGTWDDILGMSNGEPRQGSYRLRLKKTTREPTVPTRVWSFCPMAPSSRQPMATGRQMRCLGFLRFG